MENNFAYLDDSQSQELFDIETRYYDEARKCQQAGTYLAGCVMLGAALEANLMAMVTFHPHEVAACNKLPRGKKKAVKKLLDWNLGELLDVANELGWLPAGETLGADPKDWPVGAHAQVIRLLRNCVHPGCYLKDFPSFQFEADTLTASFNVLDRAYLHLRDMLFRKMREAEQRRNP